jgi:hypothetical protein
MPYQTVRQRTLITKNGDKDDGKTPGAARRSDFQSLD